MSDFEKGNPELWADSERVPMSPERITEMLRDQVAEKTELWARMGTKAKSPFNRAEYQSKKFLAVVDDRPPGEDEASFRSVQLDVTYIPPEGKSTQTHYTFEVHESKDGNKRILANWSVEDREKQFAEDVSKGMEAREVDPEEWLFLNSALDALIREQTQEQE